MHTLFHSSEPPAGRLTRWVTSGLIHVAVAVVAGTTPFAFHAAVKFTATRQPVTLYEPQPLAIPRTLVRKPVLKVVASWPDPAPKALLPKVFATAPEPVIPAKEKAVILVQADAPAIEAAQVTAPKLDLPAASAPRQVKMGGFGDPRGVVASPYSTRSLFAKTGSFDFPEGAGTGGGGGHKGGIASAGFGEVPTGGGKGKGSSGEVRSAGFSDAQSPAVSALRSSAPALPLQTPVEILSKPRPAYTAEARAQKLEGEVQLEVMFCANGEIHVMRMVRGLGLGLDEAARAAAAQIRFHPGTRGGVPVDMKGIVHIVFELS